MWLLPIGSTDRPRASLPPGRYLLPWHYTDEEVVRCAELFRSLLSGIEHHLLLPWETLPVLARGLPRSLEKTLLVVQVRDSELDEASLERAFAEVRCRYTLVQLPRPQETGYAWPEQHLKRALVSMLEENLSDPTHPLEPLNIGALPVLLAASLTPEVLEMVDLLEAAAKHRLRFAAYGVSEADYQRSLMLAAGKRLAARLSRLPVEEASPALEVLLRAGKDEDGDRYRAGAEALEKVGLARVIGGDVSIGPLARQIHERAVWGGLVEGLPEGTWTWKARELLGKMTTTEEPVLTRPGLPDLVGTPAVVALAQIVSPRAAVAAGVPPPIETFQQFAPLLNDIARVAPPPTPLPPELQARVVALLRTLRLFEEMAPPRDRAPVRGMAAVLRMLAARGDRQIEDLGHAVAELETQSEAEAPLAREVLAGARTALALTLARRAQTRSDLDRAVQLNATSFALTTAESDVAANAHLAWAEMELARENADAAEDHAEKALAICVEKGTPVGAARAHSLLGSVKRERGDLQEALNHFHSALEHSRRAGFPGDEAASQLNIGLTLLLLNELEQAAGHLQSALDQSEAGGFTGTSADAMAYLGMLAARKGNLDEASIWLGKSLSLWEQLGNPAKLAVTYELFGHLQKRLGANDEARGYYEKALIIAEHLKSRSRMALLYGQLLELAEQRGADEDASQWREKLRALGRAPEKPTKEPGLS